MWLFKKKAAPVVIDLNCPAEGCKFVAEDETALKKHINWKHPELNSAA